MNTTKRIFLILLLGLVLPSLACTLPFLRNKTEEPENSLPPGKALFNNGIVEIMLDDTYALRDIREDAPAIRGVLQFFAGTIAQETLDSLVDELLKSTVMWAVDGNGDDPSDTRLLIVKNKLLANVPMALISSTVETIFQVPEDQFDSEQLTLGKHDAVRLTLYQAETSEAIYTVKSQDLAWVIIFITTPDQLPNQLAEFNESVATFKVISIPLEEE